MRRLFSNLKIILLIYCAAVCMGSGFGKSTELDRYHEACRQMLAASSGLKFQVKTLGAGQAGPFSGAARIEDLENSMDTFDQALVELQNAVSVLDHVFAKHKSYDRKWKGISEVVSLGIERIQEAEILRRIESSVILDMGRLKVIDEFELRNVVMELDDFVKPGFKDVVTRELPVREKQRGQAGRVVDQTHRGKGAQAFLKNSIIPSQGLGKGVNPAAYIESDHPKILEKAARLHWEPLAIYNFVLQMVEFDAYPGFRKRPSSLVEGGSANSWDTAALMVSLLRASGVDCRIAHGAVDIPLEQAFSWLGYHYPGADNPLEIMTMADEVTSYFNSIYPAGDVPYAVAVAEEAGGVPKYIRLADHAFVIAYIEYVPSRGAKRGSFERPCDPGAIFTDISGLQRLAPIPAYSPPAYQGDTWIPLDGSFKLLETHGAVDENPIATLNFESILEDQFFDSDTVGSPVEELLDSYLNALSDLSKDGDSPVYRCTDGSVLLFDPLKYLPNTLPYYVTAESYEIIEDEAGFIEMEGKTPRIYFSVSRQRCTSFQSDAFFEGPVSRSFEISELARQRLTFRFVPDDAELWEEILSDPDSIFTTMYEVPGLMVRPQLVLDGVFDADANGQDDWDVGYPEAVQMGAPYFVYFSVQDTLGNWHSVENKIPAGEFFTFSVAPQIVDDHGDLQLVEAYNFGLMDASGGTGNVPKILDKQFNEEFMGRYLQLQGRHYFKQLYYSEEIMAGMFECRITRDSSVARIGVTLGEIIEIGGVIASVSGVASFCDVDLYQSGVMIQNSALYDEFKSFMGYESSAGEHELFFRETGYHSDQLSTARIFQRARNEEHEFYENVSGFSADMFEAPDGYGGLADELVVQLNQYAANGCAIKVPDHFYIYEGHGEGRDTRWVGTAYEVKSSSGTGYMIFGTLGDAPAECAREMNGAMGLPGSPKFFVKFFGYEFEAMVIQQSCLAGKYDSPPMKNFWEDQFYHWLTLGMAKEFRWRLRTYSYRSCHYRVICTRPECDEGRWFLKVLVWNGYGSLDSVPDHLVGVYCDPKRRKTECINLYNKEMDPMYANISVPKPPPRRGFLWFDYNPYYPEYKEGSCFPSFNQADVTGGLISQSLWLGAFLGGNTANEYLYRSVIPRVLYNVHTPSPTRTPTPTCTVTPTPTRTPTGQPTGPSPPTPRPTSTPTRTATPSLTPTPTPTGATATPCVSMVHCDGFLAADSGSYPRTWDFVEKWDWAKEITREYRTIHSATNRYIPECFPGNWSDYSEEDSLGDYLFGRIYRDSNCFLNWHFDTHHPRLGPEQGIDLEDTTTNCPRYFLRGNLTYCPDGSPTPAGQCSLPGAIVEVSLLDSVTNDYNYIGKTISDFKKDPFDDIWRAEFLYDTGGFSGTFRIRPYFQTETGIISYALPGSQPPDIEDLETIDGIVINFDDIFTPIPVVTATDGEVYLEKFPSQCQTPNPNDVYLGQDPLIPDHVTIGGVAPHLQYFNAGDAGLVNLYSGKLVLAESMLELPGDGGFPLRLIRTYNSSIYRHSTDSDWQMRVIEGQLGAGWDFHLGKVVIRRGQLPLIYGYDGSVRTAYSDDGDYNLGPYRTQDLWKLEFDGTTSTATVHDDDTTATFWTDNGVRYECEYKVENYFGICPYEDCSDYQYEWFVTAIYPPGAQTSVTTVNYDTFTDEWGPVDMPGGVTATLFRHFCRMNEIVHSFGEKSFTITFEYQVTSDNPDKLDLFPIITAIKVNSIPVIEITYRSIASYLPFRSIHRITKKSRDKGRDLTTEYEYVFPHGPLEDFDLNRGILKKATLPSGQIIEYSFSRKNFKTQVFDAVTHGSGWDPRIEDLAIERILCIGGSQAKTYAFTIPEYVHTSDFSRVQIFDDDVTLKSKDPVQDMQYTFYHHQNSGDFSKYGFMKNFRLHTGADLATEINYQYGSSRELTANTVSIYPCANGSPKLPLLTQIIKTTYDLKKKSAAGSDTSKTVVCGITYPMPSAPEYYFCDPESIQITQGEILSRVENTYNSNQVFRDNNILHLIDTRKVYMDQSHYTEFHYEYDISFAMGNLTAQNISGTEEYRYYYDADRNLTRIELPQGDPVEMHWWGLAPSSDLEIVRGDYSTRYEFDPLHGSVSKYLDIRNETHEIERDGIGRITVEIHPGVAEILGNYRNSHRVKLSQGSAKSEIYQDEWGNAQTCKWTSDCGVDGMAQVESSYDSLGRLMSQSVPQAQSGSGSGKGYLDVLEYNVYGQPVRMKDPSEIEVSMDYSPQKVITTDGEGLQHVSFYDGVGRLIRAEKPVQGGKNSCVEYRYDWAGHLLQAHVSGDGERQSHVFMYDNTGRLIEERHPETGITSYSYHLNDGLLSRVEYGDGSSVDMPLGAYDSMGRLISQTFKDNNGVEKTIRNYFDGDDIPNYSDDDVAGYYDYATGALTGRTVESVNPLTNDSVLESVLTWPKYDKAGRLLEKHQWLDNGKNTSAVKISMEYESSLGRLVKVNYFSSDDENDYLGSLEYTYKDPASTSGISLNTVQYIKSLDRLEIVQRVVHNASGAVIEMCKGNGILFTTDYDAALELQSIRHQGLVEFDYQDYDNVHNIKKICVDPDTGSSWTIKYDYNEWNQLESADLNASGGDDYSHEYDYDSFGNMIARKVEKNGVVVADAQFEYEKDSGLWVYGGTDGAMVFSDCWMFDGSKWNDITGSGVNPGMRQGSKAVFDPIRQGVLLFGGRTDSGMATGTWWWNSAAWLEEMVSSGPSPRVGHRMVWDDVNGRILLFGGEDGTGNRKLDIWSWNGLKWEEVSNTNFALDRSGFSVVYYPDAGGWVFFGGETDAGATNDMFLWDGQNWSSLPGNCPSVRYNHEMVYHRGLNSLMMFGGEDGSSELADTWFWDGSDWNMDSGTAPDARSSFGFVYDDGIQAAVLYGGQAASTGTQFEDMWIWDRSGWNRSGVAESGIRSEFPLVNADFSNVNMLSEYEFDGRGRRIADSRFRYEYDAVGNLCSLEDTVSRNQVAEYVTDGTGKRISEVLYGGGDDRFWIYGGESPLMEWDLNGNYRLFAYADGQLVASVDIDQKTDSRQLAYYHTDHLGSVVAVTDANGGISWPSSGAIQKYHPYGGILGPEPNGNAYRFSGKRMDPETGNYYFNARYLDSGTDPLSGPPQFLSPDPIIGNMTDPLSWNRYSYCHYNPVNFTDPTGMWEWDNDLVQKGIGGLIGFYGWEVFKSGWTAGLEAIQIEPNPDDPITPFLTLASFGAFPEVSAGVQSAKTIIGPKISPYVPKFSGKLSKFLYGADDVASQLATDTDEAVFWSGIRNGETAGAEFVSANGGATLETTLAARGVKLPVWDTGNPATVAAWRNASAEFAAGAKGNIRVLQSDAVRVNSVWAEVEFPALKANPNVNSITAVNPKTGEQILLWSRK